MKQFERINKKVETKIYGRITNYYAEAVVYKGPVYYSEHGGVKQRSDEGQSSYSDEQILSAVKQCQKDFWGASAWAVVYRVLQADYGEQRGVSKFEDDMFTLTADLVWQCKRNTVSTALDNNRVLREKPETWEAKGAMRRIIMLRDSLNDALNMNKP
jgi:hypothetical protein